MEVIIDPETENLVDIVVEGKHYSPGRMFNPLAVFLLDCCMEQIRLIKKDLVSDITKMNELEFCSAKLNLERF